MPEQQLRGIPKYPLQKTTTERSDGAFRAPRKAPERTIHVFLSAGCRLGLLSPMLHHLLCLQMKRFRPGNAYPALSIAQEAGYVELEGGKDKVSRGVCACTYFPSS